MQRLTLFSFVLLSSLLAATAPAADSAPSEKLAAGMQLVALEVFPPKVELAHVFDYRQLLVTAKTSAGENIDVTRKVSVTFPEKLIQLSATRMITPVGDGSGELKLSVGGQTVTVPVTVRGMGEEPQVSFVRDVMPILGRLGCNQGTCHGAQAGKNGFKLSLRGYDPLFDYQALTDDLSGRRFNRAAPAQSLMLMKPGGEVPHMGGVLTGPGKRHYETIKAWIANGVNFDADTKRVERIELLPQNPQLPIPGDKQQIVVIAHYPDGTSRDVTAEAFISSSLDEVVTAENGGMAEAVRRGEAAVLARYEGAYAATTITVMGDRTGYAWKDIPEFNWIDTLVYNKLKRVKLLPSDLCTDADFIRRIYLDLTGLPPSAAEVRAFLDDTRPTQLKRDELIDKLVGSAEYIEHWTHKWADLLEVNRKFLGEKGVWAMRNWLRQAVASNMPYDKFAYTIMTAKGSTAENPAAGYFRVAPDPEGMAENTTFLFLGIRFSCNKCHDHPFERWTQNQYYELAAFFAQVGRKKSPLPDAEVVFDKTGGEVKHARTGEVSPPTFPFQPELCTDESLPRREQLARWLTSKNNNYFASSFVNRVWSYMLGRGIIEPVDDIRAGNPPTNPELLDRLTREFIDSGFDVQQLIATICKSRTYQHSIATNKWNADDQLNFSHAVPRRLPAEVLLDTIHKATGSKYNFPGMPAGFRAAQLPDSSVKTKGGFLDLFGRPSRESPCECDRAGGVILSQVQNLINGPIVAEAIASRNNEITRLVATEKDDAKVVEQIFLAVMNRMPTEQEIKIGVSALGGGNEEVTAAEATLQKFEREELPKRQTAWEQAFTQEAVWTVLKPTEVKSAGNATFAINDDGSVLATGENPERDTYTVTAETDLSKITGIRLEVLPDDSLAAKGPGRASNGNFVLNDLKLTVGPKSDAAKAQAIGLGNASADFSQQGWDVAGAVDSNPGSGWAVSPKFGQVHTALFETKAAVGEGTSVLVLTFNQQFGSQHTIGKFRLSVTQSPRPASAKQSDLPAPIAAILKVPAEKRDDKQKQELAAYYRTTDGDYKKLQQHVERLKAAGDARLLGAQDLVWALINSPAFLFNR